MENLEFRIMETEIVIVKDKQKERTNAVEGTNPQGTNPQGTNPQVIIRHRRNQTRRGVKTSGNSNDSGIPRTVSLGIRRMNHGIFKSKCRFDACALRDSAKFQTLHVQNLANITPLVEQLAIKVHARRLYDATLTNNRTLVESILLRGYSPNVVNNNGDTPLHVACQNGYLDIVHMLLRYAANPISKGTDGRTPLHRAVGSGNICIVSLLLDYLINRSMSDFEIRKNPQAVELAKHALQLVRECTDNDMLRTNARLRGILNSLLASIENPEIEDLSECCSNMSISKAVTPTINQAHDDEKDLHRHIADLNL